MIALNIAKDKMFGIVQDHIKYIYMTNKNFIIDVPSNNVAVVSLASNAEGCILDLLILNKSREIINLKSGDKVEINLKRGENDDQLEVIISNSPNIKSNKKNAEIGLYIVYNEKKYSIPFSNYKTTGLLFTLTKGIVEINCYAINYDLIAFDYFKIVKFDYSDNLIVQITEISDFTPPPDEGKRLV